VKSILTVISLTDTPALPCMGLKDASRSAVAMSRTWRNRVLPRLDGASVPPTAEHAAGKIQNRARSIPPPKSTTGQTVY